MTARRRRSPLALVAPVVLTLLALAPLAVGLAPQSALADDASTLPIQVSLATLRPVAPQPDDTLVLTGTLHNVSDEPVSSLALQLELSPDRVGSRSEFDAFAADPAGDLDGLLPIFGTTPTAAAQSTLGPGATEPFRLSLVLDENERNELLLSDSWQVRELGISVTGAAALGTGAVGQLRTFLPWAPRNTVGNGVPTRVAWVWPLVDQPHRAASGVWFNDTLAPQIGPAGRLGGLLAAGNVAEDQSPLGHNPSTTNVPLPWAIDPMLVSDVSAMTSGYRVQTPTGLKPGTGTETAKQWLPALQTATTRSDAEVIPLPYADPDLVAGVRGGFATAMGVASTTGQALLQRTLGNPTLLTYGWPYDGVTNQRTVNAMLSYGDSALVLSDTALPVSGGAPAETPSAHVLMSTSDGDVSALLSDSGLDADVNGGVGNPHGSRLSLQQFLSETLMIQNEGPSPPARDFVITPARRWAPSPSYAAALLADTGKVPWIQPVSLSSVERSPVSTAVQRDPLSYPASARRAELSLPYLARVGGVRDSIADFSSILQDGSDQIPSYTVATEQTLSSAWRGQPLMANHQLIVLSNAVQSQMRQVRIATNRNSYVTLTSHGGNVPVTISNNLSTPVRVTVQVAPNQRLTFSQNGRVPDVVVPAHQLTEVHVHADAKTSGVFPVKVQLLTPTNARYGPEVPLFVRSTAYGTITLVITGAAAAALMIAVVIRLSRRALAARRSTTTPAT
jgi:hypothetical protein